MELLVPDPARHAGPDRAGRRRDAFIELLDASSATAPIRSSRSVNDPSVEELAAGYALNRFEGLNNEPDMEAPWAYHYAGRPDRTAEVVHAARQQQVRPGTRRVAGQRRLRRL